MSRTWLRQFSAFAVTAIWVSAVVSGIGVLQRYANTPGQAAIPPHDWPAESQLLLSRHRPTLVVFAHPRCPCTRATLSELESIMAQCHDRLTAHILFIQPDGVGADWRDTDLWTMADRIPGAIVTTDRNGQESRRFGAAISGQAVLYSTGQTLAFAGGITASRGHVGANVGRSTIIEIVRPTHEAGSTRNTCSVFGCPLQNTEWNDSGVRTK